MHFLLKHANKIIFFLGVCVIIVHGLSYLYGFHPFFIWTWLVVVLSTLISYVFSVLCLILIIFLILRKERFLRFSIIWLVLTSVLIFVPGYYSEIAGALSAFHLAGAKQVKTEARLLIQSCEQSSEKQPNCGYISEYPSAIKLLKWCMFQIVSPL